MERHEPLGAVAVVPTRTEAIDHGLLKTLLRRRFKDPMITSLPCAATR